MKLTHTSIYIITFLLLASLKLSSQSTKIDSLKIELQNNKEKDTIRVNLLNDLAFYSFSSDINKSLEFLAEADAILGVIDFKKGKARSIFIRGITEAVQSNFDQAFLHYDEALKLYENIDYKKGIAKCYNAMGIAYRNKGGLRKSIVYFKKAIDIEEKIGSDNLSASLLNLGTSYSDLGEFDESVSYLKRALSIAKADKNEQRVAYSLHNLGGVYNDKGNYPLALEYYKESLYIDEKLGDSIGVANHLQSIGVIYMTQKRYNIAMRHYEKALEINERMNRKQSVSSLLNNIGIIYEENGDYRSALDHYVKALQISKQIGAKSEIQYILISIGDIYLALKDYRSAKKYFTEAKKICIEIENKKTLCEAYIGLSKAYANQKDYNRAKINAVRAKTISKKSGFLDCQKEASEILFKIYKATGNYKDALQSHQQFKKLNDSLFNKENTEKITQIEYEYKYKQALDSASIRELKLTQRVSTTNKNLEKTQRNYFIAIISILLVSLISGGIILLLKLRHAQEKNQKILIEQKLLRSQMTPHFIFNSLSVLQGMILNKEEKNAVTYLSEFSKLMRTMLENSSEKAVLLSKELSAVNSYMLLQNLDANPPYKFTLKVAPEIDTAVLKIPPMLIQPFIENAIEHAFINKKNDKEIDVQLSFKGDKLVCIVKDNGIGIHSIENKPSKNKTSLATSITSERLKMLSKEFKSEGYLQIEDRKVIGEEGTLVTLVIPYKIESYS